MNNTTKQFPILQTKMNDKKLIYLDNAATTQKPQVVLDAIQDFYTNHNANIHRGVYTLSQEATDLYEAARVTVANFINASSENEIIFTRGATESINLVAQTYGKTNLEAGDEILISEMEHHANIVPWQLLCQETGAKLRVLPITDSGELDLSQLDANMTDKTKLISVVHISNTLGTINDIKTIIEAAHKKQIPVLIDGAQAIAHLPVDVQELDADFYVFSGHKAYGPTGIGVLYAKNSLLDAMPPYQTGGDMIRSVTFEETTFQDAPMKFEAGTPNIAGAIGLGKALKLINEIGFEAIEQHEQALLTYAMKQLVAIDGLRIIGAGANKTGIISFVIKKIHPHDIGTILDQEGIAIRTGHHCTQPLMKRFGIPATSRLSFGIYNTKEDVDLCVTAIKKAIDVLK